MQQAQKYKNFLKLNKITKTQNSFIKFHLKFFSTSNTNIIRIQYNDLINNNSEESQKKIFDAISSAYDKNGLGLMVVQNVPNLLEMKKKLFALDYQLVHLPQEALKKCELPEKNYASGWSYGKEQLGNLPDLLKGSFYAQLNPLTNFPPKGDNVWPQELPELEKAFMTLGNSIREVGLVILKNIDKYIKLNIPSYDLDYTKIVSDSQENTGRMLYYFPKNRIQYAAEQYNKENNTNIKFNMDEINWCEWHNDHGSLTGLVSANYIKEDGSDAKDLKLTKTGLFIQNRQGEIHRCAYGPEDLAFQLGESLQIHSGGLLHATPHAVKFEDDVPNDIARTTFALFMEPNKKDVMNLPEGVNEEEMHTPELYKKIPKLQDRYRKDMNFGDFTSKTFELYYKMNN